MDGVELKFVVRVWRDSEYVGNLDRRAVVDEDTDDAVVEAVRGLFPELADKRLIRLGDQVSTEERRSATDNWPVWCEFVEVFPVLKIRGRLFRVSEVKINA